jgi:hypothetical protein
MDFQQIDIARIHFAHVYPARLNIAARIGNQHVSFPRKVFGDQVGRPRIKMALPTSPNQHLNSREAIT